MVRDYPRTGRAGGWIFSIRRDGAVADPRRDFYAHAFVLLAIASYVRGNRQAAGARPGRRNVGVHRPRSPRARGGGFLEGLPRLRWPSPPEPAHAYVRGPSFPVGMFGGGALPDAGGRTVRLVRRRASSAPIRHSRRVLRLPPSSLPRESPAASSSPATTTNGSGCCGASEQISGRPVQPYVDALYGFADRHGFDGAGLIVDELLVDGSHHAPSRRIWPVAEAIKANLVEARLGRPGAEGKAASLAALLQGPFPDRRSAPAAGIDRLDRHGACLSKFMPASTLYHVVCAIDELSDAASADRSACHGYGAASFKLGISLVALRHDGIWIGHQISASDRSTTA